MLKLGTFVVDGTPPVGCGVDFGLTDATTGIRDPLNLRGYLLRDADEGCLLVAADWCGLMNSAYDEIVGALSRGAGLAPDRVVVHCVHQHDAPLFDFEIEPLVGAPTFPRAWWRGLLEACTAGARGAVAAMRPVSEVGHAETRIAGYASNRRIIGPDGRLRGTRWSRCADADLVSAPVGVIDPMLRTAAFHGDDGALLASLSFYATHPQVSSGRRMYSADAPGEAIRLLSAGAPSGSAPAHAFFTGTGGNVTAGKYSSTTDLEGNLLRFGRILADGIQRNLAAMSWERPAGLSWQSSSFRFPAEPGKSDKLARELADPAVSTPGKRIAAAVLTAMSYPGNATYAARLLTLGGVRILLLPGEPFVEYQLHAQSRAPDRFVAVAANCGDGPLYLPRAASFAQGGYEVESFRWCTPEIESLLEQAIGGLII